MKEDDENESKNIDHDTDLDSRTITATTRTKNKKHKTKKQNTSKWSSLKQSISEMKNNSKSEVQAEDNGFVKGLNWKREVWAKEGAITTNEKTDM